MSCQRILRVCLLALACGCPLAVPAGAIARPLPNVQMVKGINTFRAAHGLRPLRQSNSLHRSAVRYAHHILTSDYFGHAGRIQASRSFRILGEAIAWHAGRRPGVGLTLSSWRHSPPHRALLLDRRFRWVGAGSVAGRLGSRRATVWVLHLGRR